MQTDDRKQRDTSLFSTRSESSAPTLYTVCLSEHAIVSSVSLGHSLSIQSLGPVLVVSNTFDNTSGRRNSDFSERLQTAIGLYGMTYIHLCLRSRISSLADPLTVYVGKSTGQNQILYHQVTAHLRIDLQAIDTSTGTISCLCDPHRLGLGSIMIIKGRRLRKIFPSYRVRSNHLTANAFSDPGSSR